MRAGITKRELNEVEKKIGQAAGHSHGNLALLETYTQLEIDLASAVSLKHANTNDPTAGQKAALAGTSGTPGVANKYVTNDDSRNADARTPLAHSHNASDITGTAVLTNDARLSDNRAPTAHNQSADTITTGTLDGDRLPAISQTKKGAVPLTGAPSGKYLKDDGTWSDLPASGLTLPQIMAAATLRI